jgi:predicted outer membrane protein
MRISLAILSTIAGVATLVAIADPLPPDASYRPLPTVPLDLEKASGKDFDIAYIGSMIQDHQRTANLLQWQISNGQNEALKKYAADTLPDVMEHLEMAKQQYAMLTSGAPPAK